MDSCIEDPFVRMRTYQDIIAGMCRSNRSRPTKIDLKYWELTELAFKSQVEVIEHNEDSKSNIEKLRDLKAN